MASRARAAAPTAAAVNAAAVLPPKSVMAVFLDVPPLSDRKIRSILPSMLASELPIPADSCVWRFEKTGGKIVAHVARTVDVASHLDSLAAEGRNPRFLIPPCPIAWHRFCVETKPRPNHPGAVVLVIGDECAIAAGSGCTLLSAASASVSDVAATARTIAIAFGGAVPTGATVAVVGAGAETLAEKLRVFCPTATTVPDGENFLARALSSTATVRALDLREPAAAVGALPRHPGDGLARRIAVATTCAAMLFASSAFAFYAHLLADGNEKALEAERAFWRDSVNNLAHYEVSSRGEAAVREAAEAAASRRDRSLTDLDASLGVSTVAAAAASVHLRLRHVEIAANGVAASGTAPDAESVRRFVDSLNKAGLAAFLAEEPVPSGAGVKFFIQPSGASAR